MSRNLSSSLPHRRRSDPMQAFDALPQPLRIWMAGAVLPWSPASCRRIWVKAAAEGASPDAILARLDRAEASTLSRDRLSRHRPDRHSQDRHGQDRHRQDRHRHDRHRPTDAHFDHQQERAE